MAKEHLPIYGVGPFYGMGIIAATVIGIVLSVTGVYSIVRNPCYSGIMLMCMGMLFMAHNLCLLSLPFVYWLAMTILMKCSEEKWLLDLYGQEYALYCKRVNRCIPWFLKK